MMVVVVEFEIKGGHKVTAHVIAESIHEATIEIQTAHPGCKILVAYRGYEHLDHKGRKLKLF